jgi:hypothetical protein
MAVKVLFVRRMQPQQSQLFNRCRCSVRMHVTGNRSICRSNSSMILLGCPLALSVRQLCLCSWLFLTQSGVESRRLLTWTQPAVIATIIC